MNELDRAAFAQGLFTLAETFNEPMTDTKVEAFFNALSEFDIQPVTVAMHHALRHGKFFPRPADLREHIEGSSEDAAEQAWAAVLREIRRVGYIGLPNLEPRAMRAVKELWGSWQRLCETLPGEGPELVGWIKQFKATFASVGRDEQRQLTMEALHPNVRAFIQSEQKRIK